jgi:formylglycine-generating enzyme
LRFIVYKKRENMKNLKILLFLYPFISQSQIGVPIRGNYLYMSPTELSVGEYTNFLQSISEDDSVRNLPNSKMWGSRFKENNPMEKFYFRHPAYKNYPVVNITYQQAINYCNWLTGELNKYFPHQKVQVRLPTEKEWEYAAKGGNDFAIYPWGHETMRWKSGKFRGQILANFATGKAGYLGVSGMLNGNADITAPVTSYWPNNFGLYNMSGNVAEMVAEKGLIKGGSWLSRADYLKINEQQYVYSASPEVGFRYVVEIIELPQPIKKTNPLVLNKNFFNHYFAVINDTLSVGKFEVSNELFQLCKLDYLQTLEIVDDQETRDSLWDNLFPYSQVWSENYSTHPKFYTYPKVNVAVWETKIFCECIKKKYFELFNEKVEIRLPTEQEWELAAHGNLKNSLYPWVGSYLRNSKGNYLANFNPKMSEDESVNGYDTLTLNNFFQSYFTDLHDYDGEAVIAPIDSYFPNDFGIYNLAGNVAEMILDSSYTKGGSWKSKNYYLQITAKEEWNRKANPFTGFRIVMLRMD